ncbi:MAG: RluA family pseudouridine synthase [Rikenellaceae bacterium]|nr:RluA family pseudouridine synthase [Rikenellaceae bacterium]
MTESSPLLEFLFARMSEKSRTTVRSFLTHRQVRVNHLVTTRFDAPIKPGDTVTVGFEKGYEEFRHPMLRIIYEDNHLVVIDKKYGLLSIATPKVAEKTAYHILSQYVKQRDPRAMIFVLHRLDRETSGLMIFAKSEAVQQTMQKNWSEAVTERKYQAVVEGIPPKEEDTIVSLLAENKAFRVYVTRNEDEGRQAVTRYRRVTDNGAYALLDLELETGRKNQIRVQLASIGHPVAGDRKYGARTNPLGRVALHAGKLAFVHPVTKEALNFESPLPYRFTSLFDKKQGRLPVAD